MHGALVGGICHAQNFCRFVSRILGRADLAQVGPAPGLDVTMQDARESDVGADYGATGRRLMHDTAPEVVRALHALQGSIKKSAPR
jgi:hypothetical protein